MNGPHSDGSVRLSGVRGLIARRMSESLQNTAQLSFHATADASAALAFAATTRRSDRPISVEDLVAWCFVQTLLEYPDFNGVILDRRFCRGETVDLGVAMGVTEHLTVVVIRNADQLGVAGLAAARQTLLKAAQEGTLSPEQMRDGTATISNLGKGRTDAFTPILNPPQVSLLGMSAIRKAPWVDEHDELVVRPVIGLSLTVDHQWIDGAPANRFLASCCERLEAIP